jgi:hypothetical protein
MCLGSVARALDAKRSSRAAIAAAAACVARVPSSASARPRGGEQAVQDRRKGAVRDGGPVEGPVRGRRRRSQGVQPTSETATPARAGRDRLVQRDAAVAERARRNRRAEAGRVPHQLERQIEPRCWDLRAVGRCPGRGRGGEVGAQQAAGQARRRDGRSPEERAAADAHRRRRRGRICCPAVLVRRHRRPTVFVRPLTSANDVFRPSLTNTRMSPVPRARRTCRASNAKLEPAMLTPTGTKERPLLVL